MNEQFKSYNALDAEQQQEARAICNKHLGITFDDQEWDIVTKQMREIALDNFHASVISFCQMLVGYCSGSDLAEEVYIKDFTDFRQDLIDEGTPDIEYLINIHYRLMTEQQKQFLLEFVSKNTGYIFDQEHLDKLFETAPPDRAFYRLASNNPDEFDRQLFVPFLWARLLGIESPSVFNYGEKRKLLVKRIEEEGPAMFDKLYDHREVYAKVY